MNYAALPDKHSINSLRYRLFLGDVDLAPLRVLACREIVWRDWRVNFSILSASHAVCLTRNSETICELLTCAPPAFAGTPIQEPGPDAAELDTQVCGLDWSWRSMVEPYSSDATLCDNHSGRLMTHFPTGIDSEALTILGWSDDESCLLIETLHTYPEERKQIRTWTRIRQEGDK